MKTTPITSIPKQAIEKFTCLLADYGSSQLGLREEHEKMNEFFHERALKDHYHYFLSTHVLMNGDECVGFYSLHNDTVTIGSKKSRSMEYNRFSVYNHDGFQVFPAIRIYHFAIDTNYQGRKAGELKYSEWLMRDLLEKARKAASLSGSMFIVLDAFENAVPFYRNLGFYNLIKGSSQQLPVFIYKIEDVPIH